MTTAVAQGIQFGALAVLTRLYSAEAIGIWALVQLAAQIGGQFATLRYEVAIPLAGGEGAARNVLAICVIGAAVMTIAGIITAMVGASWYQTYLAHELTRIGALSTAILAGTVALQNVLRFWSIRRGEFAMFGSFMIFQAIVVSAAQIFAGAWLDRGSETLVMVTVAGNIVALVYLAVRLNGRTRLLSSDISRARMLALARQYRKFPTFSVPRMLVEALSSRGILFILQFFFGPREVGFVAMILRLTGGPASLVINGLRSAWLRQMIEHKDLQERMRMMLDFQLVLSLGSIPIIAVLSFNASDVVAMLLGPAWREAGPYAAATLFWVPVLLELSWLDTTFDVHGRQHSALFLEVSFALVLLPALWLAGKMHFAAVTVVWIWSSLFVAYNIVWFCVLMWYAGTGKATFLAILQLVLVGVMAGGVEVVARMAGGTWVYWGLQAVFGTSCLAVAMYRLRVFLRDSPPRLVIVKSD
ncbi:MAG: hypothetical protein JSS04_16350 [Proteobacteria bacterium]|nr:hypothetical protein [Pseudomonadota bacterium]